MIREYRRLTILLLIVLVVPISHAKVPANIWYIQSGASGNGKSLTTPMGSFANLELMSRAGDTIFILGSETALDTGLLLKDGQSLIGLTTDGFKPVITNSNSKRNMGCGIILANNNRVSNIRIDKAYASGIYALNTSIANIDSVDVHNANWSESFIKASFSALPGSLPHGGMIFIHTEASAKVLVTSSSVTGSAGFGIASLTSNAAYSSLMVNHTRVVGGSKIGFFDVGISALVEGPESKVRFDVSDSQVWGRLSRSGRNMMVVASKGGQAETHVNRFYSGPTGQDGIVIAVMQSPSDIKLFINDSLIENAGQMNIEGTLVNLPPENPAQLNKGKVSIEIEDSIIRNAGAVSGFEDVAANVWLGGSEFLDDRLPAEGNYKLRINNSRILGAGRVGLEFGDISQLKKEPQDKSRYDVVLQGNTISNNGLAELMINVQNAHIDARGNCWGTNKGLAQDRVITLSPAKALQIDVSEPNTCELN